MRRTIAGLLTLVVAAFAATFAATCAPPTSPLELAGTYTLMTVNESPLPFAFPPDGATSVEALDDQYILTPSGTFTEAGHKRFTLGSAVSISVPIDAGTFTRRGDTVTLESPIFGTRTGTIRHGSLTLVLGTFALVYMK